MKRKVNMHRYLLRRGLVVNIGGVPCELEKAVNVRTATLMYSEKRNKLYPEYIGTREARLKNE